MSNFIIILDLFIEQLLPDSWKYKAQVLRPLKEKKRTTICIKRYWILNEIIQLYCFFFGITVTCGTSTLQKQERKKMLGMSGLVLLKRVADSQLSLSLSPKLVFFSTPARPMLLFQSWLWKQRYFDIQYKHFKYLLALENIRAITLTAMFNIVWNGYYNKLLVLYCSLILFYTILSLSSR